MQVAVESDNSLKSESGTTMSVGSVFEGVNVVLNSGNWDSKEVGSFNKHFCVVNSLSSTCNFFTSHEEIVRVSVIRIFWVKHGVEWSHCCWIAIEHVEISLVFFFDDSSQSFFSFGAKIF